MAHMQEVKDLLTESKLSAIPTRAELTTLTQVVLKRLGEVTFGNTEARERIMELVPAAVVDSLEAMHTRAEYDERLSVPVTALLVFKYGEGASIAEWLNLKDTSGKQYAVSFRYYRCPFTFSIQTKAGKKGKRAAEWAGPFECNSVLAS